MYIYIYIYTHIYIYIYWFVYKYVLLPSHCPFNVQSFQLFSISCQDLKVKLQDLRQMPNSP